MIRLRDGERERERLSKGVRGDIKRTIITKKKVS